MSAALRIAVSEEKGNVPVTILHVTGDVDSKTYQDLEAKAGEVIGGGAKNILLDLSGVNFMGSAGLRAMHGISNKLKKSGGGQLKLLNPSDAVSRVMKTLGFDKYFDIHAKLDDALKAF
jgi:anti-sigma B factor antagonist